MKKRKRNSLKRGKTTKESDAMSLRMKMKRRRVKMVTTCPPHVYPSMREWMTRIF
jgi:hypothetical protein